jgi:hypothetical protein
MCHPDIWSPAQSATRAVAANSVLIDKEVGDVHISQSKSFGVSEVLRPGHGDNEGYIRYSSIVIVETGSREANGAATK